MRLFSFKSYLKLNRLSFSSLSPSLSALSPLDGRYSKQITPLKDHFSESALMKYRLKVEIEWLKFLGTEGMILDSNKTPVSFTNPQINFLDSLFLNFSLQDAEKIKEIERTTNHDLKAVEYFIKSRLSSDKSLDLLKEYVHFCCTSEDINNLAYSLMLTTGKEAHLLPMQRKLMGLLADMAEKYASIAMLSRTHGQSASPSTIGKEIANFVFRLNRQSVKLNSHIFAGKMNGAVGSYNAHYFVYPEYDWLDLSRKFVEKSLCLQFNTYTTQIEPHDSILEFYSTLCLFNTILIGLCQDFWHYISLGYFVQKTVEGEIGSSTMPHKVNPIDFENAEGNLGVANSLMEFLIRKLPISRFQRDLSDSTVMRNHGTIIGHSFLAYQSLLKGLGRLRVNEEKISKELNEHWEVLAEPVQMLLRKLNVEGAYEQLKELTRGKQVGKEDIRKLIESLSIGEEDKDRMRKLTPESYRGVAEKLAKEIRGNTKL